MKKNTVSDEYISSVSSRLVCSYEQKKEFLNQLRADVEAFLSETENATAEDIEALFGTPESIASSFITHADSSELKKRMSVKNIIVFAVIVALLIYLAFVVISLIDVHAEAHGYLEEGIASTVISVAKGGAI